MARKRINRSRSSCTQPRTWAQAFGRRTDHPCDSIHNFVDGILIAAAFLTDAKLGIVTSLAVAAHEIPQEVGISRFCCRAATAGPRRLFYNILSSLATVLGGVLAYFSLGDFHHALPYILSLAASSFIYVASGDLIPTLHKKTELNASLEQIALIAAGVAVDFASCTASRTVLKCKIVHRKKILVADFLSK